MKRFKFLIIPIVVMIIFSVLFNSYIDREYEILKGQKDITSVKHTYNHIVRDRGGLLKDIIKDEGDLILLGSSELSSPVEQNPINFFPFNGADYDISILGRAYTQSLQHSTIISNTKDINTEDKIAIIVSAQWFESADGIYGGNFSVNFSEMQFYDFLNNEKISKKNKIYYAKRVSSLLRQSGEFGEERIYANLYARDNFLSKTLLTILKPYYNFKEYMLETKDKVQTINILRSLDDKKEKALKDINWDEEYKKAEEIASSKVTNNDIYVEDEYYDTYLRDKYESLKDSWKDVDLLNSKEMSDYEFFLDVCNEMNIKPLIILMPVNGLYYDHLGLTLDKRTDFYNKIENMSKEKGFDVLNLQNKEYEKYYMYDAMHLGWKGWLTIDEEMYKYFKEK